MLQIIQGLSGYGKTHFVWNHIWEKNCHGKNSFDKKIMVLVPEQFSFEAEKMLCEKIRNNINFNNTNSNNINFGVQIEVLNFKRLANVVFRELGGLTRETLNKVKNSLLIYLVLSNLKDRLKIYQKQIENQSFHKDILSVIAALKNNNISCETLKKIIDSQKLSNKFLSNKLLKEKLLDIYLIYQEFENKTGKNSILSEDLLNLALKKIEDLQKFENKNFFQDYVIYIDSFVFFTESQYCILEKMISQSQDVYISLCLDKNLNKNLNNNFLNQILKTKERLLQIAEKHNVKILSPVQLEEPHRFENQTLVSLEENVFNLLNNKKIKTNSDWGTQKDFEIFECKTVSQEITFVASEISHLVKQKKFRFNEIIVVARDINLYRQQIENIFKLYELPCFLDERRPIKNKNLTVFVRFLLEATQQNFKTLSIFKLLKTGFLDFEQDEISKLEIYCDVWNVDREMWLDDFKFNPRGFGCDFNDEDKTLLTELNCTRKKIVGLLQDLRQKTNKKTTANNFIRIIYQCLIDLAIPEKLIQVINDCGELKVSQKNQEINLNQDLNQKKILLKEETEKLWESFVEVLDDISDLMGEEDISLKDFMKYFEIAVSNFDMGFLPQTLDQVVVGQVDHFLNFKAKVVFVIGLNQGVFPLASGNNLLFTEKENNILAQAGVEFCGSKTEFLLQERYYFYKSVTSASEKVFLTYHQQAADKKMVPKSFFVAQLEKKFLNLKIKKFDQNNLKLIQNKNTAFDFVCKNFLNFKKSDHISVLNNQITDQIIKYLKSDFDFANKIEKLQRVFENLNSKKNFYISDKKLLKSHLGNRLNLSPSSIERFQICKFKFFCNDILKIREVPKLNFSSLQQGVIIHYLLKELLERQKSNKLNLLDLNLEFDSIDNLVQKDLKEQIKSIFDEYINQFVGEKIVLDNKNNYISYLSDKIILNIQKIFSYIISEQSGSKFKASKFELEISESSQTKPWRLKLETGENIFVSGKIDRVDFCSHNNFDYVRVIDYKSGDKNFCLDDVYHGLNMQMLLYLFILISSYNNSNNKNNKNNKKLKPAGILYLAVKDVVPYVQRGDLSKPKFVFDFFKMNGMLLEDVDVLSLMEEKLEGNFVPARLNKDGTLAKNSSVLSEDVFCFLHKHIQNLIISMSKSVFDGDISAESVESTRYKDVCRFCDYRFICGFEQEKKFKILSKPPENWFKNQN